jgi:hypothetical protein
LLEKAALGIRADGLERSIAGRASVVDPSEPAQRLRASRVQAGRAVSSL